jgi:hypothetical protein
MKRLVIAFLAVTITLLVAAGTATAQVHENKKVGYRVLHPRNWTEVPIKTSENWIVGKFISDKDYHDHSEEWPVSYRPEMTVILFPDVLTKGRKVERRKEGEATVTEIKNPYRNYEHYLDENLHEGGWHFSLKEEKKDKDLSWTLIEVTIDKLTHGGKKRLIAGVFHADDADYVVQFIILEVDYKKKLKQEVYSCLRSFKFIPREGNIAKVSSGRSEKVEEWKLAPKDRKNYREEKQKVAFRQAKERLPDGWHAFEYKGVYLISHVDRKDAMKVAALAVALTAWLEKTFDFMGDEYVRPPIIRICASADEANAYRRGSGDSWFGGDSREIVVVIDPKSWDPGSSMEGLSVEIMNDWFMDKDEHVSWWTMPTWLDSGLDEYVGCAKLKGAKVEFKNDAWGKDELRTAGRKGELNPVRQLITMTGDQFWQKWHTREQCAALVRFLLEGPGRKAKRGKTFLKDYITALRDYRKEVDRLEEEEREARRAAGASEEKPKTDEEEEKEEAERKKKRADDWKKKEAETLKKLFERAFGEWSEKDWDKFERTYRAWLE